MECSTPAGEALCVVVASSFRMSIDCTWKQARQSTGSKRDQKLHCSRIAAPKIERLSPQLRLRKGSGRCSVLAQASAQDVAILPHTGCSGFLKFIGFPGLPSL